MLRPRPTLCIQCKGYRKLCGLPSCPILERFRAQVFALTRVGPGTSFRGDTPPSVVVGEEGYPRVSLLYGVPPEVYGVEARLHDDPEAWYRRRLSIDEVIRLRSYIVMSAVRVDVRKALDLASHETVLAAISLKPVTSSVQLAKPLRPKLRFDDILAPRGPVAPAKKVDVEGNPSLHPKLERLIWDDVKASEAIIELYRSGVDFYTIVRALSLGALGRLRSRRLVPTRWAITAVDSTISDALISKIKHFEPLNSIEVRKACYLGDCFTIILVPGAYEGEMVEIWHPGGVWTKGASEPLIHVVKDRGRAEAIEPPDGGYMAVRLAVAEYLYKVKRQAKVIVVREVTPSYYAPVGNWHIRECVRGLMSDKAETFDDLEKALEYTAAKALYPGLLKVLKRMSLISKLKQQRSLDDYFTR